MRHAKNTQTFGRNPSHRRAFYNQLVTNLIEHGRITTTLPRAKAIRGLVDQVIGYAKDGSLSAKRQARRVILCPSAFVRLFGQLQTEFKELPNAGGYTRIFKLGNRPGDNAPMAIMELINFVPKLKSEKDQKAQPAEDKKSKILRSAKKLEKDSAKKAKSKK